MPAPTAAPQTFAPVVTLSGVAKRFASGVLAVGGVDLSLAKGRFTSLLGASGCGKSTLLRLIAGLSAPSAGTVRWHAGRPDVGFVFQDPTLMPWASALDNVTLPLKLASAPPAAARDRGRAMLARVGLSGFEDAYPRQLSGGMRMRVSLARALVTEPALLLLDEPFAALDEITRHRLNDDLLDLWARQRFTALFVTHSVFESVYLSDRILIMAAQPGRIVAEMALPAAGRRGPAFRTSPEYAALCRTASDHLRQAMAQ